MSSNNHNKTSPTLSGRMERNFSDDTLPPARPNIPHGTASAAHQHIHRAIEDDALPAVRPSIPHANTRAPSQHTTQAVEEAAQYPPPYTATGGAPTYAQLDPYRGPNLVQPSSANDVFAPNRFDPIFLRLQQEFARLATERNKLQTMKNQAAEQDARDRDVIGRIRDEVILKSKINQVERVAITADSLELDTEQARLAGEAIRVARDRDVAAAQFAAAARIQDVNETMKDELLKLAGEMEVREKSLQEKEKELLEREESLKSSSTATDQHAGTQPSRGLAHNFPLTVEMDTLPGPHSDVTTTTPRMPPTGTQTLRSRSTVVHRTSLVDLGQWQPATAQDQSDSIEDSITGESPTNEVDEETTDVARSCDLCQTSSERRD